MKILTARLGFAVAVMALGALPFRALGTQTSTLAVEIPATTLIGRGEFAPPVPPSRLEYFTVINYAGRALAGDVVQVAPGERLILLGKNPTARGLGSIAQASAFCLPVLDQTFAEKLLGSATGDPTGLQYLQGGVPIAFFDEGSYVFAEYPGLEEPTPRQEHARALIGYRIRIDG